MGIDTPQANESSAKRLTENRVGAAISAADLRRIKLAPGWRKLRTVAEIAQASAVYNDERAHRGAVIYFVQSANGLIKIGYSANLQRRLRALRTGSSERLTLIGTIPGNKVDERRYHRQFADARSHGEWFNPTPELLAAINFLSPTSLLLALGRL